MLMEGVPPAMIENAAKMAGMPVGPLSLNDEVGSTLGENIARHQGGPRSNAVDPAQAKVLEAMVVGEKRFGRKNGKGFYDYPRKDPRACAGLGRIAGKAIDPDTILVQELKDRFLITQSLEAARCMEENVVTDPREADVGSILGFGFAPFAGGTISYIDGMGWGLSCAGAILAAKHGDRFAPNALLIEMARKGETFYGRFGRRRRRRNGARASAR